MKKKRLKPGAFMALGKINELVLFLLVIGLCAAGVNLIFIANEKSAGAQIDYNNNTASLLNKELKDLNNGIGDKKKEIERLQDRQKKYSDAIGAKQGEQASLNNQLSILDNRVAKAELDIELVETGIERTNLEIRKTDLEIEENSKQIEKEKNHIANVLGLIYKRDNVSTLEILLLNDTLSEFLSQSKYLEDVNREIEDSLENYKKLKRQSEKEKKTLDGQKIELQILKKELAERRQGLSSEKETKIYVLGQVKQSEREYERLLAQAKKEQEDAAAEIASLEKLVRAKIAQMEGTKLEFNDNGFIWPVTKNVITAYFHDPDYPFRYIFEHPAIDIRAAQGTTLKASASGYVARTKYGANGAYGYIMIIHGDGLSTVYGHVSKIFVNEDDYVVQGQPIGLSGGLPGTPGAGRLTTGPHLHFEVRLNGIPVDPLAYLQ